LKPSTPEQVLIDGPAGTIEIDINDPGGEHFFHGRLRLLQQIVTQYCRP